MGRNMTIKSKNDNLYFYNSRLGMIFNIESEDEISEILKLYDNFVRDTHLKSDYAENDVYDHLYRRAKGFKNMILEVTDACNMRCKYCVYSDHYFNTRSHGDKLMSFNIAKKAVDDYMKNIIQVKKVEAAVVPAVTFYGGEPLLNLDLIEKVVDYIKAKYPNEKCRFGLTTNGTLLDDRAIKVLCENDFVITISLDGDQADHDRNRVFKNGKGTYYVVMKNYKRLKQLYPDMQIDISACFDYATNLDCMNDAFRENKMKIGNLAKIDAKNTRYYDLFTEEDKIKFSKRCDLIKQRVLNAIREGKSKDDLDPLDKQIYQVYSALSNNAMMGGRKVSCIPGEKIFVDLNGDYYACEKVDRNFKIGDVHMGLDFERIAHMVSRFNEAKNKKCKNCEIEYDCDVCYANCHNVDKVAFSSGMCEFNKSSVRNVLTNMINIWEEHPKIFDEFFSSYYKQCLMQKSSKE